MSRDFREKSAMEKPSAPIPTVGRGISLRSIIVIAVFGFLGWFVLSGAWIYALFAGSCILQTWTEGRCILL